MSANHSSMSANYSDLHHGRKLRRARNVVKKWEAGQRFSCARLDALAKSRYERAKALLLAEVLKAS